MVKVLCEMWNYMLNITCYMVPWRVYLFEAHAGCRYIGPRLRSLRSLSQGYSLVYLFEAPQQDWTSTG